MVTLSWYRPATDALYCSTQASGRHAPGPIPPSNTLKAAKAPSSETAWLPRARNTVHETVGTSDSLPRHSPWAASTMDREQPTAARAALVENTAPGLPMGSTC